MDSKTMRKVVAAADRRVINLFREQVEERGAEISVEKELASLEDDYFDMIYSEGIGAGLSEQECYNLFFDSWKGNRRTLRQQCLAIVSEHRKNKAVGEILAKTVENEVTQLVRSLGYAYHYEYQKYRVKIALRLTHRRMFVFYIRYRDLYDRAALEKITRLAPDAIQFCSHFGPQLSLRDTPCWDWTEI